MPRPTRAARPPIVRVSVRSRLPETHILMHASVLSRSSRLGPEAHRNARSGSRHGHPAQRSAAGTRVGEHFSARAGRHAHFEPLRHRRKPPVNNSVLVALSNTACYPGERSLRVMRSFGSTDASGSIGAHSSTEEERRKCVAVFEPRLRCRVFHRNEGDVAYRVASADNASSKP